MFWKLAAFAVIGGVFVGLLYWYKRDRNQTIRLQGQSDAPAPDDD
jgi:membrane associated rhomboid family serine protease